MNASLQLEPYAESFNFVSRWVTELLQIFADRHTNSTHSLTLFMILCAGSFIGLHVIRNRQMVGYRRRIPLSIGGWGSRGKSGTERLKAALFNGVGLSLMSKTTGTDAMVLYAKRFEPLLDIPLHRPANKATIWEQVNVAELASNLGVDLLLWECMGLHSHYVEILQNQWMHDDISTITNTYPDHEDIQGPAGIDVAHTITCFVPKNGNVITPEQGMYPILAQAAAKKNSPIVRISALDSALLTEDVLSRFPYEEHPMNIALTLGLAQAFGIDRDFAVKEMADHVVPDIGVLRTYPTIHSLGRTLNFTNGFSANERTSTLSNWHRAGFDATTPEGAPDVWVTALVNNRDDRIFRSQVSAKIMVNDLSVDEFYLVGTNMQGLLAYVQSALKVYINNIKIAAPGLTEHDARDTLVKTFEHLRIPRNEAVAQSRWRAMLPEKARESFASHWSAPEQVRLKARDLALAPSAVKHLIETQTQLLSTFKASQELLSGLEGWGGKSAEQKTQVEKQLRHFVQLTMLRKMVIIPRDLQKTENGMISFALNRTPTHFQNKMMGIQNIKSPGMRLLETLEVWRRAHSHIECLSSPIPARIVKELHALQAPDVQNSALFHEALPRELSQLKERLSADEPSWDSVRKELKKLEEISKPKRETLRSWANEAIAFEQANSTTASESNETALIAQPSLWTRAHRSVAQAWAEFKQPGREVNLRRRANAIYAELGSGKVSAKEAQHALYRLSDLEK